MVETTEITKRRQYSWKTWNAIYLKFFDGFFFQPGGRKAVQSFSWEGWRIIICTPGKPYFAIPSENLEGHFHETLYRMSLGSVFVFAKIIICFSELISFSRNCRNSIFFNHGGTSSTKSLSRYISPKFYWGLAFHLFTSWKCFIPRREIRSISLGVQLILFPFIGVSKSLELFKNL